MKRHAPASQTDCVIDVPSRRRRATAARTACSCCSPTSPSHKLLTAGRGGCARQAHRARRRRGEAPDGRVEPPARRLDRQALSGPRPPPPRPDPGGRDRPQPRRREVRLAPRPQVLHLRDVVDPPGDPAGDLEPRPHDPDPGARARAPAQGRARRRNGSKPSSAASPTRDELVAATGLSLAPGRRGSQPGAHDGLAQPAVRHRTATRPSSATSFPIRAPKRLEDELERQPAHATSSIARSASCPTASV